MIVVTTCLAEVFFIKTKKMRITVSCFLLLLLVGVYNPLSAQNLIADPGFEIWDPSNNISPPGTLNGLTHWYEANGTPDHHHVDIEFGSNLTLLNPCPQGEGDSTCGMPHEGGGVLGVYKGNGADGTKEWAGTQLLEPLVPGDCYEISFWINNKKDNPNNLFETNQWGVFFSDTPTPFFNANLADFSLMADQWVATEMVIGDTIWHQVQFTYTAPEAYEYLYIGYMGNVSTSTFTVANDNFMLGFYVWIDEVVVERVNVEVPEDMTICPGESVTLDFVSNYSLNWTDGTTSDTTRSVTVSPTESVTYYVEAIGNQGCTKLDSVQITVLAPPLLDHPDVLCPVSSPITVSYNNESGTWSGPGIINNTTGLFDPSITGAGSFELNFSSNADCANDYTVLVEVAELPANELILDEPTGCAPHTITFTDLVAPPSAEYEWIFGDGTMETTTTPTINHTYQTAGDYTSEVTIIYAANCRTTVGISTPIQIYEQPEASFTYDPRGVNTLNNEVNFNNTSTGIIYETVWTFGDSTSSTLFNPLHVFNEAGIYTVNLRVQGPGNCVDSISQQLVVENAVRIFVPNVFSPNQDGSNDVFNIGFAGDLSDYHMQVFDRWGGLVFQSNNPAQGWNGKRQNGDPAEQNVYLYQIEYTLVPAVETAAARSEVVSGDVLLLR